MNSRLNPDVYSIDIKDFYAWILVDYKNIRPNLNQPNSSSIKDFTTLRIKRHEGSTIYDITKIYSTKQNEFYT